MPRCSFSKIRLGALLGISLPWCALSVPDAGQILNQQQQPAVLPQRLPESEQAEAESLKDAGSEFTFQVRAFEFENTFGLAAEAELQKIVSHWIGGEIGFGDLSVITDELNVALRKKGFLVSRAYLPQQEIVDGKVVIAFVSGIADGAPTVQLESGSRLSQRFVSNISNQGAEEGLPLKSKELERTVLLLNDLPTVSARSILERGSQAGSTKVVMEVREGPMVDGLVSVDTFGNRYTGSLQGVGQLAFNSLAGRGDRLAFALSGSEGLRKGDVVYSLPLTANGLGATFAYTGLEYELGEQYEDLAIEGVAHSFVADFSFPTIRSRGLNLWQGLQFGHRMLEDDALGVELRDRTLDTLSTDATFQFYDGLGGGGSTTLTGNFIWGDLELGVPFDATADAATARTQGSYTKFTYTLSRLQRVTEKDTLFIALNGQFAERNLDSSEKFILGGPNGVRAYPVGEGSGDDGVVLATEWRRDLAADVLGGRLQLVGFYDAGYVQLHKDPWIDSINTATGENCYWIEGAGMGLNFSKAGKFMFRGSVARTIGDNPGRDFLGNNADNRDADTRVWLQTLFWF